MKIYSFSCLVEEQLCILAVPFQYLSRLQILDAYGKHSQKFVYFVRQLLT